MNWQQIVQQLVSVEVSLIPTEIVALQTFEATVTNPTEKAAIEFLIAYLESQLPPAPTPATS